MSPPHLVTPNLLAFFITVYTRYFSCTCLPSPPFTCSSLLSNLVPSVHIYHHCSPVPSLFLSCHFSFLSTHLLIFYLIISFTCSHFHSDLASFSSLLPVFVLFLLIFALMSLLFVHFTVSSLILSHLLFPPVFLSTFTHLCITLSY